MTLNKFPHFFPVFIGQKKVHEIGLPCERRVWEPRLLVAWSQVRVFVQAVALRFKVQVKMGIFANKPKFTVIDKNPSPTKTVANFGLLDYLEMTTITGASVPVGYLAGGRCGLRGSCMYTAGLIGLLGGFMFAYESSAGRLMGLFPNQEEVEKYKK